MPMMSSSSSATSGLGGGGSGGLAGGLSSLAGGGGAFGGSRGNRAHGGDFSPRGRRAAAALSGRSDELVGAVIGLDGRVAFIEGGVAATYIKTVFRLSAAEVAALGAVTGPVEVRLGSLPAGSHIVNAVTITTLPFTTDVVGYDLSADLVWRAEDSVAPDAIPYDVASKGSFTIGNDSGTAVPTYGSFAASGPNDTPFLAGANPTRWPYTPTLIVNVTASGVGTPNLDDFTTGELVIVVLSVTML